MKTHTCHTYNIMKAGNKYVNSINKYTCWYMYLYIYIFFSIHQYNVPCITSSFNSKASLTKRFLSKNLLLLSFRCYFLLFNIHILLLTYLQYIYDAYIYIYNITYLNYDIPFYIVSQQD